MQIALLHKHYNEDHLEAVKVEMEKRGAPVIRAIWSEAYEMWMAVEGCHRIRAAKELGLTPVIKDISKSKTTTVQVDGDNVKVKVTDLAEELQDGLWRTEYIDFEEEE
jgi:hypothetical protein